ncbi:VRR-NUC domain-containing protein [Nanoarchaeota archaeon]
MNYDIYPNVRRKIDRLEEILLKQLGLRLYLLRQTVGSGIPDYFVHKKNESFFVEVKLEHETIKKHQLMCMKRLEEFGLDVYIVRIKSKPYKLKSLVDVENDRLMIMKVLIRQEKLRLRYRKA